VPLGDGVNGADDRPPRATVSKIGPDRPGVRRRPIGTVGLLLEVMWEHHLIRIKNERAKGSNPPKLGM
jgi:hypothetical protein